MQDIDILDVVKLEENKQYVVASKVTRNNKNYFQLANIKNPKDVMICYQDNNELVEIHDKELISLLIPLFIKNLKDRLDQEDMK